MVTAISTAPSSTDAGGAAGLRTVLALDAAAGACSAALWRAGAIAARRFEVMAEGQAAALMPMIEEVMAEGRAAYRELDRVAVTVGPGGFTGLRIALAAARGIGLAAGVPVLGVTTFAAVAEGVPKAERAGRRLVVLLDGRRGDLFAQAFERASALGAPAVLAPAALAANLPEGRLIVAGDGIALARPVLAGLGRDLAYAEGSGLPDAADVARLAARLPAALLLPARPLYLRAPEARLPAGP